MKEFKVGDKVIRCDIGEKAIIVDIQNGLYVLHFDNEEYEDLVCDDEKLLLVKVEENK